VQAESHVPEIEYPPGPDSVKRRDEKKLSAASADISWIASLPATVARLVQ